MFSLHDGGVGEADGACSPAEAEGVDVSFRFVAFGGFEFFEVEAGIDKERGSVGEEVFDTEPDVAVIDEPSVVTVGVAFVEEVGVEVGSLDGIGGLETDFGENRTVWGVGRWWVGAEVVLFVEVPAEGKGIDEDVGFAGALPEDFFEAGGAEDVSGGEEVVGGELENTGGRVWPGSMKKRSSLAASSTPSRMPTSFIPK